MPGTRLTVKEIARRAGVSIGTVDRVLHERGGVAAETQRRIEDIVSAAGYRPDPIARHLSLNRTYSLRAVLPRVEQESGYWRLCLDGIRQAERELSRYRVRVQVDEFDRRDRDAYRSLMEDVVARPGDGLLVAPVLPEELVGFLRRLDPAVPYVFFDGDVAGTTPAAVIGQDARAGGLLAGRLLSLLSRPSSRLIACNPHSDESHLRLRVEGFLAWFAAEGRRREVVVKTDCDLERPEARDAFLGELFASSEPGGIFVANASGHGVGEWLVSSGHKPRCAFVCWDLVPANAAGLRAGAIDCVISQRPFEQAREGLARLFEAVMMPRREPGEPFRSLVPLDVHFEENLPFAEPSAPEREGKEKFR